MLKIKGDKGDRGDTRGGRWGGSSSPDDTRRSYYIVWTEGGRSRERSTGTADRQRAEIALAEFIHARTRSAGPRDPSEVLITDVLADYAEERADETVAPWRIAAAIKALVPYWHGRVVGDVTRETCRSYAKARARSAGTVRRELGVLRAAINASHKNGRLTRVVAVHLPDRPPSRDRWLTRPETARLVAGALGYTFAPCSDLRTRKEGWAIWGRERAHARLHLPLFVLIGLYTGARKEAILSLRCSQVDLEAGRIDFNAPGARQTNKRRARIPIPSKLLAHLKRAKLRGAGRATPSSRKRSSGEIPRRSASGDVVDVGFVVNENGARLGDVKRGFTSACRRAGLAFVTPHTLRHTAATWLMQRGVKIWDAAGFLGMTPETLERVYGHQHPDYLKSAAEAFA